MLKNYLKIALRNLLKHRGYSLINVLGLAIGMASCILILLYVQDELSYDRFHQQADRILRVEYTVSAAGKSRDIFVTPSVIAPLFKHEFPEVEKAVRFYNYTSFGPAIVRSGEQVFYESGFFFVDSTVFDIFDFALLTGNPATALTRPQTVVISESAAQKYFAGANPIGQRLMVNNATEYEITGILRDLPHNSHLQFDFLASYTSLRADWARIESWDSANLYTYLLVHEGASKEALLQKIPPLIERERGEELRNAGVRLGFSLRPLTNVHLHWQGDATLLYAFSTIALLILLIACINYMNLATARSAHRNREVGLRKVLGAHRAQLAGQFFGESVLLTLAAMVVALLLVSLSMPLFNSISGKELSADYLQNPAILLSVVGVGLLASLIAGSYPAFFLSAFQPITMLRSRSSGSGALLRRLLVVSQFAISVILVVATLVVARQLDYVRSTRLGFDKEHLVALPLRDASLRQRHETLKKQLMQHTNILQVSAAGDVPGDIRGGYTMAAEGLEREQYPGAIGFIADQDIVATLGLELIAGPGFPPSWTPEQGYVYLINETALQQVGWQAEEAIGRWMNMMGNRMGRVVGVVRDFHFASLRQDISPLAIFISPSDFDFMLVRITPNHIGGSLDYMRATWQQLAPQSPFDYAFVDQSFDALYRADARAGQLFRIFAGLAIFVACMGLLGLASFSAEQRTREIGVRKVLGASLSGIVLLLSREFVKLIAIAFAVAVPVALLLMSRWLQGFAYRIDISWEPFVVAGILIFLIAMNTVSVQAIRAGLTNPIDALREE